MKSLLALIIVCFSSVLSFGQKDSLKRAPLEEKDQLMLNFNVDGWLNAPQGIKNDWFSRGFSMSLMYDYQLEDSKFSVAIGGGLTVHSSYMNGIIRDSLDLDQEQFVHYVEKYDDLFPGNKYKVNKTVATYIDVPFELRYRSTPNAKGHAWKVAVGGKVGRMLQFHTKLKDNTGKYKEYNYNHLEDFHFGPTVRFGYGKVGVSAYYGLNTLFKDNLGPQVTPFSVGFTLAPF